MSKHFLIIEASYYPDIASMMLEGAIEELNTANATYETVKVPGCFEIPAALKMAVELDIYDGFITLGCIIQGETDHYDYVCAETARGINQIAIDYGAAIGFGIITARNQDKALVRADKSKKNMGGSAAKAAISMNELSDFFMSKFDEYDQNLIESE